MGAVDGVVDALDGGAAWVAPLDALAEPAGPDTGGSPCASAACEIVAAAMSVSGSNQRAA
jgi:hypothetical protein